MYAKTIGGIILATTALIGPSLIEAQSQQAQTPQAVKTQEKGESKQEKVSGEVDPKMYKACTDALKPDRWVQHVDKELFPFWDGMELLQTKKWERGYKGKPYADKDFIRYSLVHTRTIEDNGKKYEDTIKQLYFLNLPGSKIYDPDEVLFFGIDHERFELDKDGKRLLDKKGKPKMVIWDEQMIILDKKGKPHFNSGVENQLEGRTGHTSLRPPRPFLVFESQYPRPLLFEHRSTAFRMRNPLNDNYPQLFASALARKD